MNKRTNSRGFTIIELMIATAVFATILLLCTFSLVAVGRIYYKGVTSSNTQEVARLITEEVSQAIQFGGGLPQLASGSTGPNGEEVYCLGGKRYTYVLDKQLTDSTSPTATQSNHVLVSDDEPVCGSVSPQTFTSPLDSGSRELMGLNMRLGEFNISSSGNLYTIKVRVVFGDDDLLDATKKNCLNQREGSQFCSVSELSTTVQKRVQ